MISSGITTVQHIQAGQLATMRKSRHLQRGIGGPSGRWHASFYATRCENKIVLFMAERIPEVTARGWQGDGRTSVSTKPLAEFMQLFEDLTEANENPRARIQLAPANLHWMTDEGLLAMKALGCVRNAHAHAPIGNGVPEGICPEKNWDDGQASRKTGLSARP